MRTRSLAFSIAAALLTLTACSSGDSADSKPTNVKASAPTETPTGIAGQTGLEGTWTPKLEAASEGAVAVCLAPSSSECARSVERIMGVVEDLDAAITATGKRYPESTHQIVDMRRDQKTYVEEGCEGDPAADGPDSKCSAVVGVTVGASTLQMTLATDDLRSQPLP